MTLIVKDGWTLGEVVDGRRYCNCGEPDDLHEMCSVPPFDSLPTGPTQDFVVPAPKFITIRTTDGGMVVKPQTDDRN